MLVHCPKCHFEQLKDTYCAKCGIEMEAYKPESTPVYKTIVTSPFFHLLLFVGIGLWGYQYFINHKGSSSFYSASNFANNSGTENSEESFQDENKTDLKFKAAQINSKNIPLNGKDAAPQTANANNQANNQQNNNPNTASSNSLAAAAAAAITKNTERTANNIQPQTGDAANPTNRDDSNNQTTTQDSAHKGPWTLNVKYIEISNTDLHTLMSANPNNESSNGETLILKIAKTDPIYKNNKWKLLDQPTQKNFKGKTSNQWFVGTQDPDSNSAIGLNLKVQLNPNDKNDLQGEIDIQRTLLEMSEGSSTSQKNAFNFNFDLNSNEVFIIGGLFPHKKPANESRGLSSDSKDLAWMKDSLLKIFFSNTFLRNESEFLIIFDFQQTP